MAIRADTMYLVAYDAPTAQRYAEQLPLHFAPPRSGCCAPSCPRCGRSAPPATTFGRGVRVAVRPRRAGPADGLLLVPRLQNDEAFTPAEIRGVVADATHGDRAHTVIFFGLRNEVLGYPDQTAAAAAALIANHLNFGVVETYDPKQEQLGDTELARRMPERIVRVQAIAKPEADKLAPTEIIARYLLGVNERNIRVVYLRPYWHSWDGRSIEDTNVEIVRRIAAGIRADGRHIAPRRRSRVSPSPGRDRAGVAGRRGEPAVFARSLRHRRPRLDRRNRGGRSALRCSGLRQPSRHHRAQAARAHRRADVPRPRHARGRVGVPRRGRAVFPHRQRVRARAHRAGARHRGDAGRRADHRRPAQHAAHDDRSRPLSSA